MSTPYLQQLALAEPWRRGYGLPRNALDPTWEPDPEQDFCEGKVAWERGTTWWLCRKCGRVGTASVQWHRPAQQPFLFFLRSLKLYLKRRRGITLRAAVRQALFVVGAALRYAAVQHPEQLGPYVERMVTH